MNTIMPTQKTKKLALMGFGNAGRAFAKLLIEKRKQMRRKIRIQCHRNSNCDGLAREPREFDRHRSGCGTS